MDTLTFHSTGPEFRGIRLTILTENTVNRRGFLAEHGLSVLVETQGRKILFDTGQSGIFCQNAQKLGISLENLDGIVLSHGHYDHTGGLPFLPDAGKLPVFIRREALEDKLCRNSDKISFRKIGIPWREKAEENLRFTAEKEEIFPDIFVLGNIPAVLREEPDPGLFFRMKDGKEVPDSMTDEQLLVIRTSTGLAVFAGCAHVGILNCLHHVRKSFPGEPFFMLLAGMHLRGQGRERVELTIRGLKEYGFEWIIPVHCTGMEAIVRMREAFGENCLPDEVGIQYCFSESLCHIRPQLDK